MRNFRPSNDHDFFRNSFIDENPIALAHARAIFPPSLSIHGPKLPSSVLAGKSIFLFADKETDDQE
jgi:hypothetical protein